MDDLISRGNASVAAPSQASNLVEIDAAGCGGRPRRVHPSEAACRAPIGRFQHPYPFCRGRRRCDRDVAAPTSSNRITVAGLTGSDVPEQPRTLRRGDRHLASRERTSAAVAARADTYVTPGRCRHRAASLRELERARISKRSPRISTRLAFGPRDHSSRGPRSRAAPPA